MFRLKSCWEKVEQSGLVLVGSATERRKLNLASVRKFLDPCPRLDLDRPNRRVRCLIRVGRDENSLDRSCPTVLFT
ncbi:lovastatin nonaketide synthase [Pseudozyma hubeiensis SY62]|uniref:Lovastatin nonaketide synthase n=1 Tax=Pseudozyma hubeiensis (strain SY62) TaxID=1305764 RepID=R9PF13_PSEHS|nr:lovastatin nonaketide synthase [Pseudozyma hubeiensis SY62]GAC99817.1 lovastatin nonaketide synthase [Pseudozyma hubeiensis SY62]